MKKILIVIISVLIAIQFIPKGNKNTSTLNETTGIEFAHKVPDSVSEILKNSCYDCHSNHTNYPWYSNIQPIAWWLNDHINEGKEELNFSIFATYSIRRQYHKLKEIDEQIEEGEMPLESYTLIHKSAVLNVQQRKLVNLWTKALIDSFESHYPADSLKRKKK